MFDLWQFGLDVQRVMTIRILGLMSGELSGREVRRMITEKQAAYADAQVAAAGGLLTGDLMGAGYNMIDVYQRAVRANCVRLSSAH
jgi:hypothetical protein